MAKDIGGELDGGGGGCSLSWYVGGIAGGLDGGEESTLDGGLNSGGERLAEVIVGGLGDCSSGLARYIGGLDDGIAGGC